MNKALKSLLTGFIMLSVLVMIAFSLSITSYAEIQKWNRSTAKYIKSFSDCEECNSVRIGGINKLDDIRAETKAETEQLEKYIKTLNYVLANTSDKEISDEEIEALKNANFLGVNYLDESNDFFYSGEYYKLYIYKPTLNTIVKQYKSNNHVDTHGSIELDISTVIIDYFQWYVDDRTGTVVNGEFNDGLPERYLENAGFVEFSSPIDAEITLHLIDNNYYYRIYVPKGKMLIKLRTETYSISAINSKKVAEVKETALPYNNTFVVWQNPENDPIKIDLSTIVKRDGIESINLEGKPNCAWGAVYETPDVANAGDVIVDKEIVEDVKGETPSPKKNIIVIICIVAVIGIVFLRFINKKE